MKNVRGITAFLQTHVGFQDRGVNQHRLDMSNPDKPEGQTLLGHMVPTASRWDEKTLGGERIVKASVPVCKCIFPGM